MKLVPLGNTGVQVSQMCLGTMMFGGRTDEPEAARIIDTALDRGVTFLDTASMYSAGKTEEILGRLLKGRRDKVFITTKVNVPNGAEYPAQIGPSLDASLARMQTDYADLYLIHWARAGMNPLAMMTELSKVVRAGKARFIGVSNFPAWLIAHFNAVGASLPGTPRFVNNQIPYNLIERGAEIELLPQAVAENIAITCYRPLMAGVLSGKYHTGAAPTDTRAETDTRIPKWAAGFDAGVKKLMEIASGKGVPPSNIALAWLRSRPGVTCPIVGVTRLAQLTEALGGFEVELSPEEQTLLADAFGSEVKEVSEFYGPLRRKLGLI